MAAPTMASFGKQIGQASAAMTALTEPSFSTIHPCMVRRPTRRGNESDDPGRRRSMRRLPQGAASAASDFVEITTLNEPHEFVPLGAREPNRVLVLADPDA